MNNLCLFLSDVGLRESDERKLQEAEQLCREALAWRREHLGENSRDTLVSFNNVGYVLHDRGRLDEAAQFYRRAVVGRSRVLGPAHPSTLYAKQGKYDEAAPYLAEALEARSAAYPPGHARIRETRQNLIECYRELGRDEEARALEEAAAAD